LYFNAETIYGTSYAYATNGTFVSKSNHSDSIEIIENDDSQLVKDEFQRKVSPSSEPDCFCPNGRKNWIYYSHCSGAGAGIRDREIIVRNLIWLADELCAKVALKCPPRRWLNRRNHGCSAPKTAEWSSYFTTVRKSSNGTTLSKVDILYSNVNETNEKDFFHGLRYIKGPPTIEKYNLGIRLTAQDEPFVLDFSTNFWKSEFNIQSILGSWPHKNLTHREYNDTCGLIDLDPSEELLGIAHLAINELGLTVQDFVTLHLRRGDSIYKCETDAETVMKYLNCSLRATDNVKQVVVLTNEKEEQYLNDLSQNFSYWFPDKELTYLDQFMTSKSFVDKMLQKNLTKRNRAEYLNDNCYFFNAEKAIISLARYHLDRGRSHCATCDPGGSVKDPFATLIR
jgi:hypothetical protein